MKLDLKKISRRLRLRHVYVDFNFDSSPSYISAISFFRLIYPQLELIISDF